MFFGDNSYRDYAQMLRVFVASVALVVITVALLLHATHHGAHANSATHCGFWTDIDAGLSCR